MPDDPHIGIVCCFKTLRDRIGVLIDNNVNPCGNWLQPQAKVWMLLDDPDRKI